MLSYVIIFWHILVIYCLVVGFTLSSLHYKIPSHSPTITTTDVPMSKALYSKLLQWRCSVANSRSLAKRNYKENEISCADPVSSILQDDSSARGQQNSTGTITPFSRELCIVAYKQCVACTLLHYALHQIILFITAHPSKHLQYKARVHLWCYIFFVYEKYDG